MRDDSYEMSEGMENIGYNEGSDLGYYIGNK